MLYNTNFLEIHSTLIDIFLIKADSDIWDISYSNINNILTIQVVMMEGAVLSEEIKEKIQHKLPFLEVIIRVHHISKDMFNEIEFEWFPIHYQWLEYVLFSKAEIV